MKLNVARLIPLSLILALIAALLPVAPAYAAHTITSVSPSQIANDVDTTITIIGTNFDSSSQVSLGSVALLRLTQSATEITALVPKGIPPGSYSVTVTIVTSAGTDAATCASPCVTVSAPPPPQATTTPPPFSRPQFVVRSSR